MYFSRSLVIIQQMSANVLDNVDGVSYFGGHTWYFGRHIYKVGGHIYKVGGHIFQLVDTFVQLVATNR